MLAARLAYFVLLVMSRQILSINIPETLETFIDFNTIFTLKPFSSAVETFVIWECLLSGYLKV